MSGVPLRFPAVVADREEALRDGRMVPVPPYAVSGLDELLGWTAGSEGGERALVLRPGLVEHLGLPRVLDRAGRVPRAALAVLDAPGWNRGAPGPWTTFWRGAKGPTVHVCVGSWVDPRRVPLHDPGCGAELAARLDAWQALTGCVYRGTPGVAGVALLRALNAHRWNVRWQSDPTMGRARETEVTDWSAQVKPGLFLHQYDRRRAYLSAAGNAEVGVGELVHTGPVPFNPREAGWWQVELSPWTLKAMPCPFDAEAAGRGSVVVTTPTLKLLDTLHTAGLFGGYRITQAWTRPAVRLFRGWAETLNGAYLTFKRQGNDALADTVKLAYKEGWGLLGREGGTVHRPDWHATIQAQSKVTVWRAAFGIGQTVGRWPVAVRTDALIYSSPDPDPVSSNPGLPLGPGLGHWEAKSLGVAE